MIKLRLFLLVIVFIALNGLGGLYAQKFEAELATLSGGATIGKSTAASGGSFVALGEGNLRMNIALTEPGFYNIFVQVATPFGAKTNAFKINGASVDFALAQTNSFFKHQLVTSLKLDSGQHQIEVVKSWGWINIDYFEFELIDASSRFKIRQTLVTPNATEPAQKLYQFLLDHYGKKIISGVMTLSSMDEVNWLKANTGKEPALVGLDFMHCGRNYSWYNDNEPMNDARKFYNRNGIPALCWHWRDPLKKTEAFYAKETDFDISKVSDSTSAEYQAMIRDIDYISGFMLQLQRDSVAVIWRPLHEAAGGWFWWGTKGAGPCKALWRIMYNRMVHHHGIRNLIWMWTREPNDDAWYPGDEYVDMVGRDIYKQGNHSSHILEFNQMNALYGGEKMLAISECGSFPDPDNLQADGAAWSLFMPWYGDFVRKADNNPLDLWKKTMAHEYVITLDEMPNLRRYQSNPNTSAKPLETKHRFSWHQNEHSIFISGLQSAGRVFVFDALGKVVLVKNTYGNSIELSMQHLSPGIYLVRVNQYESFRIMKRA